MDAVTLINREGGSTDADDDGTRVRVGEALSRAGISGSVELVAGGKLGAGAAAAVREGARLVIVGGGDGSISAAAGALAGSEAALGVLPLGTLNHFTRDLGIPDDLGEAAAVIAAAKTRTIDIAEVNGRAFVNNAAIGLYPLMLVDRESQQHRLGRSKRLAMLVAALRTMTRFHAHRLRLGADGGEARVDTPLLFVGNNEYRLSLPGAGRRESLDGGQLCVMVMRSKSLPGFLAATFRALAGISREDDMVRLDEVRQLKVDSARRRLTLAIDGETVEMRPPLTFRIRPRALKVLAPGEAATTAASFGLLPRATP